MECILSLTMAQMFTYDKTIKKLLSSFFRESWFEKEKGGCYE